MKLVKVFKNSVLSFLGKFKSDEETTAWINECVSNKAWGLPERPELMLDEATGEMIPTGNILPAEYEIVIEDITAQVEQEKINAEALNYLNSTDWYVTRFVEKGTPVPPEITAEREAARLRVVR